MVDDIVAAVDDAEEHAEDPEPRELVCQRAMATLSDGNTTGRGSSQL